ncbi:hypothetical protein B6I21_06100 [candidate division KSB1 bacterium 4572_119]|nr:MAG: hypothetical protein B6I21_06100 [candidate division KSB1 bacterium 4572_119]
MKHSKSYFIFLIYFFLIPCLFFFCKDRSTTQTTSKGQEYRLFKLHYENSSGEKGVTTFDSDKDGNLTVAVWELLDGSRSSINFYTYDKNGNLEKKYREFSDSLFSTQLYEYDSKGNLIYQSYERSDGRKGSTMKITTSSKNIGIFQEPGIRPSAMNTSSGKPTISNLIHQEMFLLQIPNTGLRLKNMIIQI